MDTLKVRFENFEECSTCHQCVGVWTNKEFGVRSFEWHYVVYPTTCTGVPSPVPVTE